MAQITLEQRKAIFKYKDKGFKNNKIAELIGVHPSSIGRELKRNSESGVYCPEKANNLTKERHIKKKKRVDFTSEMKEKVHELLVKHQYSPEQICQRLKLEGKAIVSHETIYRHIWHDKKNNGTLYKSLRTKVFKRKKRGVSYQQRGQISNRVLITERPDIVNQRVRMGDLEIDTIIGKDHKGAIITINDRVCDVVRLIKVDSKEAEVIKKEVIKALFEWKDEIKTITSDNGKEFAYHKEIAEILDVQWYFARPYKSTDRGSNENMNRLIRQYIPKKTDFSTLNQKFIQNIEYKLNTRPRKKLNFMTPNEVYLQWRTN